jgi:hypothetical protein
MPYKLLRGELNDLVKELNELEKEGYNITSLSGAANTGGIFYTVVYKVVDLKEYDVTECLPIFPELNNYVHDATKSRNWLLKLTDFLYITK